jgi:acyl-CoA reductase-like NAD-dependent aldehyde dehydrogenase
MTLATSIFNDDAAARPNAPLEAAPAHLVAAARAAQHQWAAVSIHDRCRLLRRFRGQLIHRIAGLTQALSHLPRSPAAAIASEIMPLLEACRFLEKRAPQLLAPRQIPQAGPRLWFGKLKTSIARRPLGIVLIIGPANYPLFLPGVQALQALLAGNAILVKPGVGGTPAMTALRAALIAAGMLPDLLQILPESIDSIPPLLPLGIDHVIFTGSQAAGRRVLELLAPHNIPSTMELSGCDAFLLLPGADLDRAARALIFGTTLNGGASCIAPQRVIASHELLDDLNVRTMQLLPRDQRTDDRTPWQTVEANTIDDAIRAANDSPFALGAAVFGPEAAALAIAARLHVGIVTINDVIAPTADPSIPFGGCRGSGFGITRGAAGLLALTRPVPVIRRRGKWLPHLDAETPHDAAMFTAMLTGRHATTLNQRIAAWRNAIRLMMRRGKQK